MKTKTIELTTSIPCLKKFKDWNIEMVGVLLPADYVVTDLKLSTDKRRYEFELHDDHGYIANYYVRREDFERSAIYLN